jgi:CRP/FNR family transcriptional regulator, cyclic AMP receptor protein
MTPMPLFGGELLTQLFIHAGFLLTATAYLVRDILWLRALAILANLSVAAAVYRSGTDANWVIIAWATAFVLINVGQSTWLLYERHLARLSDDERRLANTAFRALDPVIVRRLLRRGTARSFAETDCIVRQGVPLDHLFVVVEGEAAVLLGGRIVARLKAGDFIGEIGFLSADMATATVVATTVLRCLAWPAEDLRQRLERQPDLCTIVHAAIGRDLAAKTAAHNLTLSQV